MTTKTKDPETLVPAQSDEKYVIAQPREGEFVRVDLSNSAVKSALKDVGLEGHDGNIAVWYSTTPDGDAVIRFRDETHAYAQVPVAALSYAVATGR